MTSESTSNISVKKNLATLFSFRFKMVSDRRVWLFLPFISTVVIYTICYLVGKFAAGLSYEPHAILRDFMLQLCLAGLMYLFFRRAWAFVAFQALIVGLFFLGHAAKVAFHGVPATPDDIFAISDLFWVLQKWQRALMVAFGICIVMLAVVGTHWRRVIIGMSCIGIAALFVTQATAKSAFLQLRDIYGNSCWDMRQNLVRHGATLHTVMEGLRYVSDSHDPPSINEVNQALASLEKMQTTAMTGTTMGRSVPKMRNLHMIVLESFWDLTALTNAKFSRNPFDADFYQLWKETGFSRVLPPVYGGYTANSEFEALAGFPVEENSVKFERRLRNDVPALPKLLSEQGYRTMASHPNVAGFWNRTNAYRRIGFQTYWSIEHFDLDDMNGEFLSDESLYRQVLEKIKPELTSKVPIFNYVLTYTGHVNYPLNEKRPRIIKAESQYSDVSAYANTVYYKSKELMDYIAALQKMDPDGLIVLFGDHAPFLGPNHGAYRESHLLFEKMSDWTPQMLKTAYNTPLVIINGRKGPVEAGILPLYRLPSLLLSLMGLEDKGMLDYTLQPHDYKIRPLPGRQLVLDQRNHPMAFNFDATENMPPQVIQWMQQMATLSEDLFVGQQFSLTIPQKTLTQPPMLTHHIQKKRPIPPSL